MLKTEKEYIAILDDDHKLRKKWSNKKTNAAKENIQCDLSFAEYCYLVEQAGLKSSDLGFKGKKYVLARYNDTGNYDINNCRFITQHENAIEKKLSLATLEANRRSVQKARAKLDSLSQQEISNRIKNGKTNSIKEQRKRLLNVLKNRMMRLSLDQRYCGAHNSQFNTYWLTNGLTNIKWSNSKGPYPQGFRRGRIM